jgi:hypothetical protein
MLLPLDSRFLMLFYIFLVLLKLCLCVEDDALSLVKELAELSEPPTRQPSTAAAARQNRVSFGFPAFGFKRTFIFILVYAVYVLPLWFSSRYSLCSFHVLEQLAAFYILTTIYLIFECFVFAKTIFSSFSLLISIFMPISLTFFALILTFHP